MNATQPAPQGLSSAEAARRLAQFGPNLIPESKPRLWLNLLRRLWGPVPWMLETAVILEVILGKYLEAGVIAVLIVFNAVFSALQEKRSADALAMLRNRLQLNARVLRDGVWQSLPVSQLVPGDTIHIRMGDVIPADVRLLDGSLLVDQSSLTGESLPVEVNAGQEGFAGALARHGEATAEVTATGVSTRFGQTAELVRQAHYRSNLERVVFSVTRSLIILDGILALVALGYALWVKHYALLEILPFVLILLVASVPVALPATFTIATALGAQDLAHRGVLVTNLAAIEEAAGMDVLCTDKTGTITLNHLRVADVHPFAAGDAGTLLRLAAMASDPATQDPIDLAILAEAQRRGVTVDPSARRAFEPFAPETKRSEAQFEQDGGLVRVAKGAPHAIAPLCTTPPDDLEEEVARLASQGYRVLAVAHGNATTMQFSGLVLLEDPPRPDSAALIESLKSLGVRVIMITGDSRPTAQAVAHQVGLGERTCGPEDLVPPLPSEITCDVFAEVLPEHKFALVQALQKAGHITGMTGDGVNDAPALKQAQVGIAVANATDIAKAAASLVLTQPGLGNIVSAIQVSRQIYQRMVTYTLNKIVKTIQIAGFLALGLILTGEFVVTPLLVILLLLANDFATMSIATDNVRASSKPDRWHISAMLVLALSLGIPLLLLTLSIFWVGRDILHLPLAQLQTLSFITLVFSAQGMVYLVRERQHFWTSRPGRWLMLASSVAVLCTILLATMGILMRPLSLWVVLATLGAVLLSLVALDLIKVWVLERVASRIRPV